MTSSRPNHDPINKKIFIVVIDFMNLKFMLGNQFITSFFWSSEKILFFSLIKYNFTSGFNDKSCNIAIFYTKLIILKQNLINILTEILKYFDRKPHIKNEITLNNINKIFIFVQFTQK